MATILIPTVAEKNANAATIVNNILSTFATMSVGCATYSPNTAIVPPVIINVIKEKRTILPDHKFKDLILAKFMNRIMKDGKKSVSEKIVYGAFDQIIDKHEGVTALEVLERAVENAKPRLEVKSRRVGGATYQVPLEVSGDRSEALALRWIVSIARSRKGTSMGNALAKEIMEAYEGEGSTIRRRDEVHRMAQANKAFAHFRW